jgi:hypothetical protein
VYLHLTGHRAETGDEQSAGEHVTDGAGRPGMEVPQ